MSQIDALSLQFRKYDQVEKAHTYRLAENEADEFDEDYEIATLDFGQFLHGSADDRARFAQSFGTALKEIGFAVLTGHGVDPALYEAMEEDVHDLFTSTPLEEKMRFRAARFGSVAQGYSRSRKPATFTPTWSRAGSGAAARSTSRRSVRRRFGQRISGRRRSTSPFSGGWCLRMKPCSSRSRGRCSRALVATPTCSTTS